MASSFGVAMAQIYVGYGVFLFFGLVLGVHALVLATVVFWMRPSPRFAAPALQWGVDIVYGFVNPLIYLVVLVASGPTWQKFPAIRIPLSTLGWTLFLVIWTLRLVGPTPMFDLPVIRRATRLLLVLVVFVVIAHGLLDLGMLLLPFKGFGSPRLPRSVNEWLVTAVAFIVVPASLASLYLIPVVRTVSWIRALRSDRAPDPFTRLFLVPVTVGRVARGAALAVVVLTVAASAPRWSDRSANAVVLAHRDQILRAADQHDVDPKAIAALMWVTQRDQLSPFRDTLERAALAAWEWDEKGDFFLESPLNISVGVMQIKPATLRHAVWILDIAMAGTRSDVTGVATLLPAENRRPDGKELRELQIGGARWLVPGERIRRLRSSFLGSSHKPSVVAALLDDDRNVEAAALILALYQLQWESGDRSWSIRQRPDILATLYQIGFDRSKPHVSPVSNRFGTRVLEIYNSGWIKAMFGEGRV